jgi:iron complex transport system substrate-binding protein
MNRRAKLGALLALAAILAAAFLGYDRLPSQTVAPDAPAQPARITSLTLATDEILSQLVPLARVVSVTSLVDDAEISNVAGFYPPQTPRFRDTDLERIIAIAPDLLCVAPYNSIDFLKQVERSGIPIYRHEAFDSIDQIEAGIVEFGRRLGAEETAATLVATLRQRRKKLAAQLAGVRRPSVLFWTAGFTSGRLTALDDIIREAGGTNRAAELGLQGPVEISPEQAITADPEYLLLARWSADEQASHVTDHPVLKELRAVREQRVITIEGRYLSTVSQFVVAGAEQLARQLHPEQFRGKQSPAATGAARSR